MSTEILGYIGQIKPTHAQTKQDAPQQARTINKDKLYYIKQKAVGVIFIGLGAISAALSDDGTFLVFMFMMSIPLFGKDKILMMEEGEEE